MRIKICKENEEKIEEVLLKSSGKATCRVIFFTDVFEAKLIFKKKLPMILKKHAKNISLTYCLDEKLPNAYKYQSFASSIEIETNGRDFFLVKSERIGFWPGCRNSSKFSIKGNDKEITEEIKCHFLKGFLTV